MNAHELYVIGVALFQLSIILALVAVPVKIEAKR